MTTEPIQVKEGAYRDTAAGPVLAGGTCADCGTTFFPIPATCPNCLSDKVDEVSLATEGKLFAWSTIHMPGAHFKPPFTVGYVDLPDGPRVFGPIEGDAELSLNQTMRIEIGPLWEEDGTPVIGHRFRAITSGDEE